ncbi:MAG: NADP-dependent oxidoreductase [Alphaproteobacteria bacterium]
MSNTAKQVVYTKRPDGPIAASSFEVREVAVPVPEDGQVVIANHYLSLDPYMRMHMLGPSAGQNLGHPIEGRVVGRVAASRDPRFKEGDTVFAMGRWESHSTVVGDAARHVDPLIAPLPAYLSVLGFTGLTAQAGLRHYASMQAGETLFVSAASGAVGSVAGQIGKINGLRVVGCAGSDAKVDYVRDELGFDAGINYKTADDLTASIAAVCPNGIDIDFENVGGRVFDAVFRNMASGGRLVICGAISQYNRAKPEPAIPSIADFITKRLTMRGFSVRDHMDEIEPYIAQAAEWLRDGKLKYRETIVDGLENAPTAFTKLFTGENFGKLVIKV